MPFRDVDRTIVNRRTNNVSSKAKRAEKNNHGLRESVSMKIPDKDNNMVLNSSRLTNTTAFQQQNQSELFDKSIEKVFSKANCP